MPLTQQAVNAAFEQVWSPRPFLLQLGDCIEVMRLMDADSVAVRVLCTSGPPAAAGMGRGTPASDSFGACTRPTGVLLRTSCGSTWRTRPCTGMVCWTAGRTNLVYDRKAIPDSQLEADLKAARASVEPIPEYALDVHTQRGRKVGRTKDEFLLTEHAALNPR